MNKTPPSLIRAFVASVRENGLTNTLQYASTLAYDYYFDLRHGLDTFSWVARDALDATPAESDTASYQPTPVRPLRSLLQHLSLPSGSVLVDFGCGKGRVLLVASEFAFREVRGLEYSPGLCRVAEQNCRRYLARCSPDVVFQVLQSDAREYDIRDDETVFFLFNPFGPEILRQVIENIQKSLLENPRKAWIVYLNPLHREVVKRVSDPSIERDYEFGGYRFGVFVYD